MKIFHISRCGACPGCVMDVLKFTCDKCQNCLASSRLGSPNKRRDPCELTFCVSNPRHGEKRDVERKTNIESFSEIKEENIESICEPTQIYESEALEIFIKTEEGEVENYVEMVEFKQVEEGELKNKGKTNLKHSIQYSDFSLMDPISIVKQPNRRPLAFGSQKTYSNRRLARSLADNFVTFNPNFYLVSGSFIKLILLFHFFR